MYWTDDPVQDAERYYAEQEEKIKRLPVCADCGEHIQDEFCYEFNGEYICERCLEDLHKKAVEFCQ